MYANKKSVNKKNENKNLTDKRVELETITQSEATQIQKDTSHMVYLNCGCSL